MAASEASDSSMVAGDGYFAAVAYIFFKFAANP